MQKNIFLAALAAAALTMGFTSCNDNNAADYQMNVFLRVDAVSSDTAETKQIAETYVKALGISDQEEMTVKVTGKDSLDCVSTVAKKCAKAEKELEGQQWTDFSAISVNSISEKNATQLYSKTFGTAADNDGRYFFTAPFGYPDIHYGGHTTSSIHLQAQGSSQVWSTGSNWMKVYPYFNDIDLNKDAGGKYVYMMFGNDTISFKDLQAIVRADDHSEELNKYIADVLVLVSDKSIPDFKEFTYNGATYRYAQGIYGDPVKWDMNYKAGGPYLYLFYSTDAVKFQRVLDIDESLIAASSGLAIEKKHNFTFEEVGAGPWDVSKFVEAVKYNNGNVEFMSADAEFNQGAGGSFIHMRADYISFDRLKNLTFDENGKAIK